MNKRALIMNSGGVDSATCLALAVKRLGAANVDTIAFNYGQRHKHELQCAERLAKYYGVSFRVIDLTASGIFSDTACTLFDGAEGEVPKDSFDKQREQNGDSIPSTYVPFRNGLFLAVAGAVAMSIHPDCETEVYFGAHKVDETMQGGFHGDSGKAFVKAMNSALQMGTFGRVKVVAPFGRVSKAGLVKRGLKMKVPYELTWSCYEGAEKPCGVCGTCIERREAFEANGAVDPATK